MEISMYWQRLSADALSAGINTLLYSQHQSMGLCWRISMSCPTISLPPSGVIVSSSCILAATPVVSSTSGEASSSTDWFNGTAYPLLKGIAILVPNDRLLVNNTSVPERGPLLSERYCSTDAFLISLTQDQFPGWLGRKFWYTYVHSFFFRIDTQSQYVTVVVWYRTVLITSRPDSQYIKRNLYDRLLIPENLFTWIKLHGRVKPLLYIQGNPYEHPGRIFTVW